MEERISAVNRRLKEIGSRFEAVTETRIAMHIGGLRFIVRDFASLQEMETFVYAIK